MELDVRVGGRRCGEVVRKTSKTDREYITLSKCEVKKATNQPLEHEGINTDFIESLIIKYFPKLRKPVVKNLAGVTMAFINVLEGLRSGEGKITLGSIARGLPIGGSFKILYQRLRRFLNNRFLDSGALTEGLINMLMGQGARGMVPVIVDETKVSFVCVILGGIAFAGRVLPLGILTYTNKQIRDEPEKVKSRNYLETLFVMRVMEAFPRELTPVFIFDRGYARVRLIKELLSSGKALFLLRAPKNVVITQRKGNRVIHTQLREIKVEENHPIRLNRVIYKKTGGVEVDIVIYKDKEFEETWYLVLPPGSKKILPTNKVIELYRSRMRVEQAFRDYKHHLGVRGLRLVVNPPERLGKLLQGFILAYIITVAIGETKAGYAARERFETPRKKPRHGTKRILSSFRIGSFLISGALFSAGFVSIQLKEIILKTIEKLKYYLLFFGDGLYFIIDKL
jgi:hypothetical protein